MTEIGDRQLQCSLTEAAPALLSSQYHQVRSSALVSVQLFRVFQQVSASQPSWDAVGRPLAHASGQKHTTGEAVYSGDVNIAGEKLNGSRTKLVSSELRLSARCVRAVSRCSGKHRAHRRVGGARDARRGERDLGMKHGDEKLILFDR